MLPKPHRLTKKQDFDKVFKRGKGCGRDFIILKILKNNLRISRFGIVVSQKISKKATIRNKVKRIITEAIKLQLAKIKKGFDVVLITKSGIEKQNFQKIYQTLEEIFKKAELI